MQLINRGGLFSLSYFLICSGFLAYDLLDNGNNIANAYMTAAWLISIILLVPFRWAYTRFIDFHVAKIENVKGQYLAAFLAGGVALIIPYLLYALFMLGADIATPLARSAY